jgi:hypothetical protein
VLAEMAGLQVVRLDNVIYVTSPEKATRLRKEWRRPLVQQMPVDPKQKAK